MLGEAYGDGGDDVAAGATPLERHGAVHVGGGTLHQLGDTDWFLLPDAEAAPYTVSVTTVRGGVPEPIAFRAVGADGEPVKQTHRSTVPGTLRPAEPGPVLLRVAASDPSHLLGDYTVRVAREEPTHAHEPTPWNTHPQFVLDATPENRQVAVAARPAVGVRLWREPAPGAVDARTVRLVDGTTGTDVPATRTVDDTGLLDVVPDAGRVAPGDRLVVEPRAHPDATAVVLNLTAVAPSAPGNVRVFPTPDGHPGPLPDVSHLNVVPGVDQPNLVTVPLGADGTVTLATEGTRAHLVADVAGWYGPGGAAGLVPTEPVRVLDTRDGTGGVPSARVRAGRWVELRVTGRHGVPEDALAVTLNVTGTQVAGPTNVRVYPTPEADRSDEVPTVSHLNLRPGRDQPNAVVVRVGARGTIRLYTQSADVHLLADLTGYYSATGDHGFVPLDPTRIADTRAALGLPGALRPGVTSTLRVGGAAGVLATAGAVVLDVTAVAPDAVSNVRVFPASPAGAVPLVSTLNVVPGRDEPNHAVARLGHGGAVSFYSQSARLGLVVDLAGYFTR